jgi:phenylalanyl-tRNA synthetase alpha chain
VDFDSLSSDLRTLQDRALTEISAAADPAALEALQIQYLGKKGDLTAVLRGIGALPAEDRPRVGAIANEIGEAVKGALAARAVELNAQVQTLRLAAESVDVTLPGRPVGRGTLHPIPETIRAIAEAFGQFGFVVYEGPEVETDFRNFQMLNIRPATSGTRYTWTCRVICFGLTRAPARCT